MYVMSCHALESPHSHLIAIAPPHLCVDGVLSAVKADVSKRNERAEVALLQLLPMLAQLNVEQAIQALAINKDSVPDTIDYVLGKSDEELIRLLGPNPQMQQNIDTAAAAKKASNNAQPTTSGASPPAPAPAPGDTKSSPSAASGSASSPPPTVLPGAPAASAIAQPSSAAVDTKQQSKSKSTPGTSDWDATGKLVIPPLSRSFSDSAQKTIVFKVVKTGDESAGSSGGGSNLEVTLQPVLDRNRIPIDTDKAGTISLSLRSLIDLRFHLPSDERIRAIKQDMANRVAEFVYQIFEEKEKYRHASDTESMSPLSVMPSDIKISDYDFDFSAEMDGKHGGSGSRYAREKPKSSVRSVSHKRDGPILFTAVQSSSDNPLLNRSPIELFTESLNATTHNILHLHVDDMSADVALDSVMLTGSGKTIDSCRDFKKGMDLPRTFLGCCCAAAVLCSAHAVPCVFGIRYRFGGSSALI